MIATSSGASVNTLVIATGITPPRVINQKHPDAVTNFGGPQQPSLPWLLLYHPPISQLHMLNLFLVPHCRLPLKPLSREAIPQAQ